MVTSEQLFGQPFSHLKLKDVLRVINEEIDEPIHWEAKGGDRTRKEEVARQVGAFANSRDGGFLILGVDASDGHDSHWIPRGQIFPDEPAVWLTNVVSSRCRPLPTFELRTFHGEGDRAVVVVHVLPTTTPPCIVNGSIYERLPGCTRVVDDPHRLSEMFSRGDHALANARAWARQSCDRALKLLVINDGSTETVPEDCVAFGIGIASTARSPGIISQLFSSEFEKAVSDSALRMAYTEDTVPIQPKFSQSRVLAAFRGYDNRDRQGLVFVSSDGSVGAAVAKAGVKASSVETLFRDHVIPIVRESHDLMQMIGGRESISITVKFRAKPVSAVPDEDGDVGYTTIERGALTTEGLEDELRGMEREALRAAGHRVYEPVADGGPLLQKDPQPDQAPLPAM